MAYGMSALEMGTFRRRREKASKTATMADFSPDTAEETGSRFLSSIDMESPGRYSLTVDFTERRIRNRNLADPMVFGAERYPGREFALTSSFSVISDLCLMGVTCSTILARLFRYPRSLAAFGSAV